MLRYFQIIFLCVASLNENWPNFQEKDINDEMADCPDEESEKDVAQANQEASTSTPATLIQLFQNFS